MLNEHEQSGSEAASNPLGWEGPMIRTSMQYLFNLAATLEKIGWVSAGPYQNHVYNLIVAEDALRTFLLNSVYAHSIRNSTAAATTLLNKLHQMTNEEDWNREIPQWEAVEVQRLYNDFKTILLSELGVLPSYFVSAKGGYDTLTLLDSGTDLFPASLAAKVPEAIYDAQQATKALAFEIGTAAGFHVYRCLEAVLRRYWTHVSSGKAPPKVRSIGVYVAAMERSQCGDPKVIAALRQINELHRNPLIHPEVALDLDETITIVGIARSAVSAMLSVLPEAQKTTTSPPGG